MNLFETEIFCNIIHLLPSLLINLMHPSWKKIFIFKKYNSYWHQTFEPY